MSDISENYNNSREGNNMRPWLDKMKELEKKFVVLTHEELSNLLAVAASASQVLDDKSDRDKSVGRMNEIQHLYEKYFYSTDEAIAKINKSAEE